MKARHIPKPALRVGLDARLAFRRGVGTYTAQLAIALACVCPDLELLLLNAPSELKNALDGSSARFMDIPVRHPALYEQFSLPSLARRERLDLLHYTDNSGALFARSPYVLTLHDAMMVRHSSESHDGATLKQRMVGFYKRFTAGPSGRSARLVLTVSESSKRDIVRLLGVPEDHVRVVPEGVEAERFKRPRAFRKSRRRRPVILVQGAVDQRKNIPGVLRTAAVLKGKGVDCTFRVIGYPMADFKRAGYVSLAKSLGVEKNVEWAGQIESDRLPGEYWDADLFLYASLWEGFGLPVLEAFVAGTPVVASDTTSIPEVAGNAARLADPRDADALAAEIRKVLTGPSLRETLVERGKKRASLFTWEKTAKKTAEVYHEAAGVAR